MTVAQTAPGVYAVTFTGAHANLNFGEATGATIAAVTGLVPRPDSSVDVRTATVHDGTTSPDLAVVQTIDTSAATGGTYVLHFVLPNSQGVLQDVHTGGIRWNASAADVFSALSSVLNPNNTNPALPFTDNVAVELHNGVYTITFRGSMRAESIAYIDLSGLTGTATVLTRMSGIDYYDVDTLNVSTGSGNDVVNVQGTTATTNVSTGAGNDRFYVSSGANVGLADHPSFISGTLNGLLGTLNINAGTGRQTLMISDEASAVGDAHALITRDTHAAQLVDPDLSSTGEIFLIGFAPQGISIAAAATGNFAGGITIWTGSGDDHVVVNATHNRAGVNEVTTLNTGLGNDTVTVTLTDGTDGEFVLDTQGPDENVLHLSNPVQTGDYNTPADGVGITLSGTPSTTLTPDQFVVDAALDSIGVMVSPPPGTVATVTLTKPTVTAFTLGSSHSVSFGGPLSLGSTDTLTATVNGVAVDPSQMHVDLANGIVTFDSTSGMPVGALVLIEIIRHLTQQFALPQATGRDDDIVDASGSTLPLTIFGGQGNDTITAGVGGDVIFGDRGRVLWFEPGTVVPPIPQEGLSVADMTTSSRSPSRSPAAAARPPTA